ncbi:MAG: hypothetical protein KC912_26305, partial [Proteobacteria bacterium]|nr:hypothetical protein [Pseudomonadota bacterium]
MKAHRPDKDTGSTPAPAKQAAENDHGGQTDREVYLRRAQAVVDQSNEDKDDAFWHAMNGENKGVEKDGTTKPDEWYRGVKLEGDQVKGLHGGNTGDVKTIEQFRTQISEDLNFNDAFTNFKSVEAFESATVKRYAAGGDDKRVAQVTHIARNLWAYAKTGMDVGGKTNIAELQGMLYSLDTMIRDASMSNTPHEGSFEIPGAEGVELDSLGDGFYGRASILECRMLADLIKEMPAEEKTILELVEETVPRKEEEPVEEYVTRLDNFDETKFIVDMS